MNIPGTTLEILTLGRFSISVDGKPVATDWPDETIKMLFCSLLSPLDLHFSWDRICRSMLGVPATLTSRSKLEKTVIVPLSRFLIKALGFNPLTLEFEYIKIDPQRIHVDAHEFYNSAHEGLRQMSRGNHAAALDKFSRANTLYTGSYLEGMSGIIITNTRKELELLYQTTVIDAMPLTPISNQR